jgi:hypothetical protein
MTLSLPFVLMMAVAAPILVLIVIARVKAYRRRASTALTAEDPEVRLEPRAELAPSLLLSRLTLPQRTYLRQQYGTARVCFILSTYVLFVTASVGLLPEKVHAAIAVSATQQVWQSYQSQLTAVGYFAEVFGFLAAVIVITTLKTAPYVTFNRTRPLSFRFLFWGRASVILASLLAATQVALLASVMLLTLIYGPVWRLGSVLLGSMLRLDLSMLIFSIFVFLSFIPGPWSRTSKSSVIPAFLGGLIGSQAVFFSRFLLKTPTARALFLFPAQIPPNSCVLALVPLVCVAGLLYFAERLSTRFEV